MAGRLIGWLSLVTLASVTLTVALTIYITPADGYYWVQQEGQSIQEQPSLQLANEVGSESSNNLETPRNNLEVNALQDDHFMILNDEDLQQHGDILRHLATASKEEVETIVASNPAIQAALLKKVDNVVHVKEQKSLGMPSVPAGGIIQLRRRPHRPNSVQQSQMKLDEDDKEDEDEDAEEQEHNWKPGKFRIKISPPIMGIGGNGADKHDQDMKKKKKKLKKKLIKIGAGLKAKLVALKKKVTPVVPSAAAGTAGPGAVGALVVGSQVTGKPKL